MRFVVVYHAHGLVRTRWKPPLGALPVDAPISELLAPLSPFRDRITVVSGLGNPVALSRAVGTVGHERTNTTLLTAAAPQTANLAGGESIDAAVAALIAGDSPRRSIVLPMSVDGGGANLFFRSSGSGVGPASWLSGNPREAAELLFGGLVPSDGGSPPEPSTLRERLTYGRGAMLGRVSAQLRALRARAAAEDRDRLDAHAAGLDDLSRRFTAPGETPVTCAAPDLAAIVDAADPDGWTIEGSNDYLTAPAQIDNVVRAFACDITRVAALHFNATQNPNFQWLFGGDTQACRAGYQDWHVLNHDGQPTGGDGDVGVPNLMAGQRWYAEQLSYLLERLAETPDCDGSSTLLDNTLVLWISDFGDENHANTDLPIVLAGLDRRYDHGRHVDGTGTTIGDLHSTILQRFGAPDDVRFGLQGRVEFVVDDWTWRGPVPDQYHTGALTL